MLIPDQLSHYKSNNTDRIEAELGFDIADLRGDNRFLFLCFTNRCGSTYLAHLLHATGQLAYPDEHFIADTVIARARAQNLRSFEQYLSNLPATNGWIAAKLGLAHLLMLARFGILDAILPRTAFILLERQDKTAQAISRIFAFHSNVWAAGHAHAPFMPPKYSRTAINQQLAVIEAENAGFGDIFAANGIIHLRLNHEEILHAPQNAMAQLSHHLAMPPLHAHPETIAHRRQADEQNALWKTLYLAGR